MPLPQTRPRSQTPRHAAVPDAPGAGLLGHARGRAALRAVLVLAAVAALTGAGVAAGSPPNPASADPATTGASAVMALLDSRTAAHMPRAVADYGLGPDGRRVEVRLAIPGTSGDDEVTALLAGIDPGLLDVRGGAAPPVRHGELRGGEAISGGTRRCTLGFVATHGAQDWVLTAGHCTRAADTWYDEDDDLIGTGAHTARDLDVGAIPVTSRSPVRPVAGGVTVHGARTAPVGSAVCLYGSTSGRSCGTVTARNRTVNFAGTAQRGMVVAAVCSAPGDSGGPFVTADGQAQGVHSGGGTASDGSCTSYFTPIDAALGAFGLTLRTG